MANQKLYIQNITNYLSYSGYPDKNLFVLNYQKNHDYPTNEIENTGRAQTDWPATQADDHAH